LIKLEWIRRVKMLVEDRNLRKRIKKPQEGNKKSSKNSRRVKKNRNEKL